MKLVVISGEVFNLNEVAYIRILKRIAKGESARLALEQESPRRLGMIQANLDTLTPDEAVTKLLER